MKTKPNKYVAKIKAQFEIEFAEAKKSYQQNPLITLSQNRLTVDICLN